MWLKVHNLAMPLAIGTKAPDFTLKSLTPSGMVDLTLSENFGKSPTVIFFFPAAFSGVCTDEMCQVNQGLNSYEGATVWGISADSAFALAAWAKQEKLEMPLLSDYKREVIAAYDVVLPSLAGLGPSAARATYVIDKDGIIRCAAQTPAPTDLPDFDAVKKVLANLG